LLIVLLDVLVVLIYDIRLVCFGTKIIFLQAKSL